MGGPRKQKSTYSKEIVVFVNRPKAEAAKIGHNFKIIKCLKIGVEKNIFTKKWSPKLIKMEKKIHWFLT